MNTHPLILHQKISEQTIPSMRYTGQMGFGAWQEECRKQLKALLGMDKFIRCEPDLTITEDVTEGGMRRIHFLVQTEEGYYTHCDFLLPDNIQRPLPLCVCLQGHSSGAHISLGRQDFSASWCEEDF